VVDVRAFERPLDSGDLDAGPVRAQLQLAAALELAVEGTVRAVEQFAAVRIARRVEGDAAHQPAQFEQAARKLVTRPLVGLLLGLAAGFDHRFPAGGARPALANALFVPRPGRLDDSTSPSVQGHGGFASTFGFFSSLPLPLSRPLATLPAFALFPPDGARTALLQRS
jgi:hypothetical protein